MLLSRSRQCSPRQRQVRVAVLEADEHLNLRQEHGAVVRAGVELRHPQPGRMSQTPFDGLEQQPLCQLSELRTDENIPFVCGPCPSRTKNDHKFFG